ncbi:MAG: DedA family protein [Deltaproteobacteria bacterium]|nr:DedA family protein [Deltaproteobacteria bacterium]MBK8236890.1 DedA family protein [Deltaproteobacteria bacterium]MBK8719103.1 DedA family protein [Deltaproteobacteria bacterium]MBP7288019.1 DedA family protein [Nannocystaceae bacterium]
MRQLFDIVLHLDRYLNGWAADFGGWLYVLLFAVVFAETGLVVTPFLPGDSLLFAVGALSATEGSPINVWLVGLALTVAAIAGDAVNYAVGRKLGPRVFSSQTSRLLNRQHLMRAQAFYARHGGKTIILARFIPIIRTFAPFVAGIGEMSYARFALYNVSGAIAWVWSFLLLGNQFGELPFVKKNFTYVIFAIIIVSVIPAVVEFIRARRSPEPPPT